MGDSTQLAEVAEAIQMAVRVKLEDLNHRLNETIDQERDRISSQRTAELQRIAKETQDKIAELPPIPYGISIESAAELAAIRRDAIALIKSEAKRERVRIATESVEHGDLASQGVARIRGSAIGSENLNREQVVANLKDSLYKARIKYTILKPTVKAKYPEYDAIINEV